MLFVTTQTEGKSVLIDMDTCAVQRAYKSAPVSQCPNGAAYCSRRQVIFASQESGAIFAFGALSAQPLRKSIVGEKMVSLAVSDCGTWLLGGGVSGCIYCWHLATGELLSIVKGHVREVLHLAFSTSGTLVASSSADTTCRVHNLVSLLSSTGEHKPQCIVTSHTLAVNRSAFFGTQFIVTVSLDRTCRITDVVTRAPQLLIRLESPATALAVAATDDELVIGCASGDMLFACPYGAMANGESKVEYHRVAAREDGHVGSIVSIATLRDGSVVSVSEEGVALRWQNRCVVKEVLRWKQRVSSVQIWDRPSAAGQATSLPQLKKFPNASSEYLVPLVAGSAKASADLARPKPMGRRERKRQNKRQQQPLEGDVQLAEDENETTAQLPKSEAERIALREQNDKMLMLANELYRELQAEV